MYEKWSSEWDEAEGNLESKYKVLYVGFCVGGSSDGDPDGRKASGWAKDAEL